MSNSMNIHNIATVEIERRQYDGYRWTQLLLIDANGTTTRIALHGPGDQMTEVVDRTRPVSLTGTVYEPSGYVEDMRNAGRGHLVEGR